LSLGLPHELRFDDKLSLGLTTTSAVPLGRRRSLHATQALRVSGVWTFGSRFSLRPGGTRDSSPAIYRRVGHKYDLRPGGTLEVGSGLLHGEEGKARRIPYFAPNSGVPLGYRLEAYATLRRCHVTAGTRKRLQENFHTWRANSESKVA
jgi:hypothetical protein